jgi:hypothetical protein
MYFFSVWGLPIKVKPEVFDVNLFLDFMWSIGSHFPKKAGVN